MGAQEMMVAMMEKYANNLEAVVEERTTLLIEEKQITDEANRRHGTSKNNPRNITYSTKKANGIR